MRVRLRGLHSAHVMLANGKRKIYWYAWRGGPRLRGEPGTPQFMASYNEAVAHVEARIVDCYQVVAADALDVLLHIHRAAGPFPVNAWDEDIEIVGEVAREAFGVACLHREIKLALERAALWGVKRRVHLRSFHRQPEHQDQASMHYHDEIRICSGLVTNAIIRDDEGRVSRQ